MKLRGKQKRYLRSQAHHLQPIFQVGKGGLNDAMITQIAEALEKRELIKITLLQNTDEVAEEVVEGKWGEDEICKTLLEEAGYNYNDVMHEIQRLIK